MGRLRHANLQGRVRSRQNHAHPPVATAFTVADIDLDQYILPEAVLTIGDVPTCDYGTPSTMEIPDSLDPYIQNHDAFLLRNHGALTVGCDLTKAFFIMEEVETNLPFLSLTFQFQKKDQFFHFQDPNDYHYQMSLAGKVIILKFPS